MIVARGTGAGAVAVAVAVFAVLSGALAAAPAEWLDRLF